MTLNKATCKTKCCQLKNMTTCVPNFSSLISLCSLCRSALSFACSVLIICPHFFFIKKEAPVAFKCTCRIDLDKCV